MNTKHEEIVESTFRDLDDVVSISHEERPVVKQILTNLLTTLKADWLRKEIEKLESVRDKIEDLFYDSDERGERKALTSIITRWKEELKVLESK